MSGKPRKLKRNRTAKPDAEDPETTGEPIFASTPKRGMTIWRGIGYRPQSKCEKERLRRFMEDGVFIPDGARPAAKKVIDPDWLLDILAPVLRPHLDATVWDDTPEALIARGDNFAIAIMEDGFTEQSLRVCDLTHTVCDLRAAGIKVVRMTELIPDLASMTDLDMALVKVEPRAFLCLREVPDYSQYRDR